MVQHVYGLNTDIPLHCICMHVADYCRTEITGTWETASTLFATGGPRQYRLGP